MNKRLVRPSGPKITKQQKQRLIEMIKNSPQLDYGNRGVNYTRKSAAREIAIIRWKEITKELNSMDDKVKKEWQTWKKTWSDIRTKMARDWSSVIEEHLNKSERKQSASNSILDNPSKTLSYIGEMFRDADEDNIKTEAEFGEFNQSSSVLNQSLSAKDRIMNHTGNDGDSEDFDNNNFNCYSGLAQPEYNNANDYNSDPLMIQMKSRSQNTREFENSNHMRKEKLSNNDYKKLHKKKKFSFNRLKQFMDRKAKVKEDYYSKKLILLERDIVAKESIATSLKMLIEKNSNPF